MYLLDGVKRQLKDLEDSMEEDEFQDEVLYPLSEAIHAALDQSITIDEAWDATGVDDTED